MDPIKILSTFKALAAEVAKYLKKGGKKFKTVSIVVRFSDFDTKTRSHTIDEPSDDKKVLETGQWNYDDAHSILYLSCKDPYLNNTWKVMEKGFVMVWIGDTEQNKSGIQIRVDNAKSLD